LCGDDGVEQPAAGVPVFERRHVDFGPDADVEHLAAG
jgi:hypothetical protein